MLYVFKYLHHTCIFFHQCLAGQTAAISAQRFKKFITDTIGAVNASSLIDDPDNPSAHVDGIYQMTEVIEGQVLDELANITPHWVGDLKANGWRLGRLFIGTGTNTRPRTCIRRVGPFW